MTAVTFTERCNAPAFDAWQYLTDYRSIPVYFDGVARFAPNTPASNRLGATYDVTAKIGPSTFSTKVETVVWEPGKTAAFRSTKILKTNIRYSVAPITDTTCDATVSVEVQVPGVLGKALAPFIRSSLAKTASNISARLNA